MNIICQRDYDRSKFIGGSDAAAALGLSPWKSPMELWLEKTGKSSAIVATEAMRWGVALEDVVAKHFEEEHKVKVWKTTKVITDGVLAASIDRFVTPSQHEHHISKNRILARELLEVKTARSGDGWGNAGTDEIPLYYQCQVQQYLGITRCELAHIALLVGGSSYLEYLVKPDVESFGRMKDAIEKWWRDYVVSEEPPDPRCADDVEKLFPGKIDMARVASLDVDVAIRKMIEIKASIAEMEADYERNKTLVCSEMGENTLLTRPDGTPLVTWRHAKGKPQTDWNAVLKELPNYKEVVAKNTVSGNGYRQFLIKDKKEE